MGTADNIGTPRGPAERSRESTATSNPPFYAFPRFLLFSLPPLLLHCPLPNVSLVSKRLPLVIGGIGE